jgi:hypothetical protein
LDFFGAAAETSSSEALIVPAGLLPLLLVRANVAIPAWAEQVAANAVKLERRLLAEDDNNSPSETSTNVGARGAINKAAAAACG